MVLLPSESLGFIVREMHHAKNPVALATLADSIVTKDNAKTIAGVIPLTKDLRARHRLAAAAIRGDFIEEQLYDTFHASLTSTEATVREDAVAYLAVDSVPARLRPLVLDLLQRQIAKGELALDTNTARKLLDLGARDRKMFDVLFSGLDSAKSYDQWRALTNMRRHAALVPDELRSIYIRQVEKVLSTTTQTSTKKLGARALEALGAVTPGV
jgi:hypothetical protein